jgi:hypothetical protein
MSGRVWKFSLDVPSSDALHGTVHAFLRTSEHGSWTPDEGKQSDAFVLHYRRGNWNPPPSRITHMLAGFGTYEQFLRNSGWVGWKTPPMQLSVAFRPVPAKSEVKILLEYDLGGPDPDLVLKVAASELSAQIADETASLARYIQENLELDALPTLTTH